MSSTFHESVFTFMTICRWILLRMINVLDYRRENQNAHFMLNNFLFRRLCRLWECQKIWWNQRGHKWQYNMAQARCMLYKQGYARTHTCARARNTYCFSTATVVSQTGLYYVIRHCLSGFFAGNNEVSSIFESVAYSLCRLSYRGSVVVNCKGNAYA